MPAQNTSVQVEDLTDTVCLDNPQAFMVPSSSPSSGLMGRAAVPARCAIALRASWQKVIDEASGDPYWWNEATGETTWDEPGNAAPAAALAASPVGAAASSINVNKGLTSLSAPGGR